MGGDNSSIGFYYTQCFDLANNSAVYQPLALRSAVSIRSTGIFLAAMISLARLSWCLRH